MSKSSILPVIMAGGSGTRMWPLSRSQYPKQFLTLCDSFSMIQSTVERLTGLEAFGINSDNSVVICNNDHRFIVAEQLRRIDKPAGSIILEPVGRNTAPAIALAALNALNQGNDPVLLVLAADHVIQDKDVFHQSVKHALSYAEENQLVTFGIEATAPETGYGYIQRGSEVSLEGDDDCLGYSVARFVEKPDQKTAEEYLASGEYYWNSGMFMFKASRYLEELKLHRPDILEACEQSLAGSSIDLDFLRLDDEAFAKCPDESIDYAVMEKTDQAVVVPMAAGWSDVGSWSSLWDVEKKNADGNVLKGDVISQSTGNSYVHSESRLVATVGVDDLVIVETKDAVLVAHKDSVQDIKSVVSTLKKEGRSEWQSNREVYRPWGVYDSIDHGTRHQVKHITVKPGAKLSVQMHYHRAEHWVVVSGTAKVTVGEETFLVSENESTYIPIGIVHALENPGSIPLELIEVQSGSYLGEDDIVRFEDRYGRS
ncbi:mannose-1-phosphate guanylyltransferase/mannose-6-phosphate isomerase [Litoribacillus peritrichatus]|uniref:mannose-1-phosphate guanylyltransferase n=1 Tax=Litoribacillus peritrichatus TaxID=718191 RepID=A0ABP7M2P6_9GAMM